MVRRTRRRLVCRLAIETAGLPLPAGWRGGLLSLLSPATSSSISLMIVPFFQV
jgi:hypothetical protein